MQVYPQQIDHRLPLALKETLAFIRARRGFDPTTYVKAKCALLNDYMRRSKLKACVVAVSGGVDSALVLALTQYAAREPGSPIERIVPICLPVFTEGAASNQSGAASRGEEVAASLGLQAFVIDLSAAHQALKAAVDTALGVRGNNWASGQLTANTRTPAIYYVTSLLTQIELPSIVVGTTNRDEGAYFGYVGKASDAIVDVQLIADLHKSEVYRAAQALGVPPSILDIAPAGDMYDGRTDEDVYGASYDAAELHLSLLCAPSEVRNAWIGSWDEAAREHYAKLSQNLETLHRYNAHKYLAEWPGVQLNILPTAVPGGWQYGPAEPHLSKESSVESLSGLFTLPEAALGVLRSSTPKVSVENLPRVSRARDYTFSAHQVSSLLEASETRAIRTALQTERWFPVGTNGYQSDYVPGDPVGSWRLRTYNEELAALLWSRLQPHLASHLIIPQGSSQDANGARIWRAVGVSPLFRFIKYETAGSLVAHYDAPFDYGVRIRTLKSLIIYLTDGSEAEGGVTRFIADSQDALPAMARKYADWERCATESEVLCGILPRAGNALLLDHRILHDSSPYAPRGEGAKIIIRTDIIYQGIATPCVG